MVNIKGHDFEQIIVRNSYDRRALQYQNKIINHLKIFGLTEDDVDVPLEKISMRKAQATTSWYLWDHHLFFSYNGSAKFVENLAMVEQVIEYFIKILSNDEITKEEFLELFAEDTDILKQREAARDVLGVEEHSTDFETIHKNYKRLSKEHHPDMPNGCTERFKKINVAHKILKKELC
ncbi:J domain-containing protein [Candidatus Woesearchaeota archaeon]|nr:J domain-containing protein [Candidatus Woesearchaeota archaeon]